MRLGVTFKERQSKMVVDFEESKETFPSNFSQSIGVGGGGKVNDVLVNGVSVLDPLDKNAKINIEGADGVEAKLDGKGKVVISATKLKEAVENFPFFVGDDGYIYQKE
jgi:hypothetical protein